MDHVVKVVKLVDSWVWGYPLLILLFGTHIFLTVRLGFVQRYLKKAISISLNKGREGPGDISQFGSLMTALAATIGTGNIVGVGTAVAAGGPGAVFWMWLTGVFGMATKYSEATLAVKYRVTNKKGEMAGGPMYVLERGLHQKWLGATFAVFAAISAFGIGNAVQSNSVATLAKDTFHIAPWITGLILTVATGLVVLGGIRAIARFCAFFVPLMAFCYLVGCAILLFHRIDSVPSTLGVIISSAFSGQAAVGGFLGAGVKEAMRFGVARGLFSNESGLGSAPIVAAAAQTRDPVRQGLVSMTGTFWDTVVVCAVTGVVIVNSGEWQKGVNGAVLTKAAFNDLGSLGPWILTFGLLTFVFSTLIGWGYYGEKAVEYLGGERAIAPYRWLWVVMVFVGSILSIDIVWSFADIANGLMALPNLIALVFLSRELARETKTYINN